MPKSLPSGKSIFMPFLLALFTLTTTSAWCQDNATSKSITYEVSSESIATADNAPKDKQHKKYSCTIKVCSNGFIVTKENQTLIYDCDRKRITTLNPDKKTYSDISLYADPAFRVAELKNRLALGEMLKKTGAEVAGVSFDPVYASCTFGIKPSSGLNSDEIKRKEKDKEVTYTYKDSVLDKFTTGTRSLNKDEMFGFSRFLIYCCRLFPDARTEIVNSGMLPSSFMFTTQNVPQPTVTEVYVLKSVKDLPVDLQIPSGFKPEFDKKDILKPVYARLEQLGKTPPSNVREKTVQEVEAALKAHNVLDAFLTALEYGLQTGDQGSDIIRTIKDDIPSDPMAQSFLIGLRAPKDSATAKESLRALDSIDRTNLKKGYLLDIFRANLITTMQFNGEKKIETTGESSPVKSFINVLTINPYITGAYIDLGKIFYEDYDTPSAWRCWDIARSLYPKHTLLTEVYELEANLEKQHPEFFKEKPGN